MFEGIPRASSQRHTNRNAAADHKIVKQDFLTVHFEFRGSGFSSKSLGQILDKKLLSLGD